MAGRVGRHEIGSNQSNRLASPVKVGVIDLFWLHTQVAGPTVEEELFQHNSGGIESIRKGSSNTNTNSSALSKPMIDAAK